MTLKQRKSLKKTALLGLGAIALIGSGIAAYSSAHHVSASETAASPAPQAMPVDTVIIKPENIQIWKNYSGHVVAVDRAEIRPQVSGRIQEIKFEDGQKVEKDDILIVIDPLPYEAAHNQAKAQLKAAKTEADLAEKEYKRAQTLIKTEAISQGLLDERMNKRQSAAASVQAAEASMQLAEINLDYAHVKAPISGLISRAEITEGNLVQAGANAPVLTSIVASDNVYVDFEIDERTYLNSVRTMKSNSAVPVKIQILDGEIEYKGTIHSFDNRIDAASGTMRARALFENKDGLLLPGMSSTVFMGQSGDGEQIIVTERAIGTDQNRKFVYVIEDGKAAYREINMGQSVNGSRVILSGLEAGDTVITGGIVHIRPGIAVTPKPADADANKENPVEESNAAPAH